MRIALHDYSGHPFQVQLARELARRGHQVAHLYSGNIPTPRGALTLRADDPDGLSIEAISIGEEIDKYGHWRRWRQERRYAELLAQRIGSGGAEIVISGNAPPDIQRAARRAARAAGAPFIFWLQDLYGEAARHLLRRRLAAAGRLAGSWLARVERRCLASSDAIVAITDDFRPLLRRWGIAEAATTTIENWAPLEEIAPGPKTNPWAARHGLTDKICFLYAGTLGRKHDPACLADLSAAMRAHADVRVVVASEGPGADFLAAEKQRRALDNLLLLPFQSYAELPQMLASADVATAQLEPDAGSFSVPSKVLTYLAAGRPILAAMPADNLAARLIVREQAGIVVPPADGAAFVAAAAKLLHDPEERARLAANGRSYAQRAFAIAGIADRFEAVMSQVLANKEL